MRTPVAAEFQAVDELGASTKGVAKRRAHECFRGVRFLVGTLFISIAIWVGLGWGLSLLVSGF
jgi:hypothetical protein